MDHFSVTLITRFIAEGLLWRHLHLFNKSTVTSWAFESLWIEMKLCYDSIIPNNWATYYLRKLETLTRPCSRFPPNYK